MGDGCLSVTQIPLAHNELCQGAKKRLIYGFGHLSLWAQSIRWRLVVYTAGRKVIHPLLFSFNWISLLWLSDSSNRSFILPECFSSRSDNDAKQTSGAMFPSRRLQITVCSRHPPYIELTQNSNCNKCNNLSWKFACRLDTDVGDT